MVVLTALVTIRMKNHAWAELVQSMEIGAPGALGPRVQRTARKQELEVVTILPQPLVDRHARVQMKTK